MLGRPPARLRIAARRNLSVLCEIIQGAAPVGMEHESPAPRNRLCQYPPKAAISASTTPSSGGCRVMPIEPKSERDARAKNPQYKVIAPSSRDRRPPQAHSRVCVFLPIARPTQTGQIERFRPISGTSGECRLRVMVLKILRQDAAQVMLVKDDDVIPTFGGTI